jgi:Lhr-like helicase
MDVFALRESLVKQYSDFAKSFTSIRAEDIRSQVEAAYASGRYWPDPLIQINPRFKPGRSVAEMVDAGELDPRCRTLFPLALYQHQEFALGLARRGASYVVTTGTGSGKSLCFFIPIVDAVLRAKAADPAPRTRAIVIYPMNALANSQMEELEKYLGKPGPVTFARYTGQESEEERTAIRNNPPDILLTNFMMLELLMTRQAELDQTVIRNCEGLQFLVLDELHTYRGRQGADVAMLIRRVRERLGGERLQCVGTSATMSSGDGPEDRTRKVAEIASKFFATKISPFEVVTEDLERVTDPRLTATDVGPRLGPSLDSGLAAGIVNAELRSHPLAVWVETTLGLERPDGSKWVRARPQTFAEAAALLASVADRPVEVCGSRLREFLLAACTPERDRPQARGTGDQPFFAFKLHQFLSGAGVVYTTIEPLGARRVSLDGQQFLPGEPTHRLFATVFCRDCGQEYHPIRLRHDSGGLQVLSRDIDDMPARQEDADGTTHDGEEDAAHERLGFATPIGALEGPDALPFQGRIQDYPETWVDTKGQEERLKRTHRSLAAERHLVAPDGAVAATGTPIWFLPGKFRFCLRCGTTHGASGKDANRLASLSAEGRSSATTVLVSSALRWMHDFKTPEAPHQRKLLAFTDNRQDAALQAGHFNDFTFVCLLRGAVGRALRVSGTAGLQDGTLGDAVVSALGFDLPVPPSQSPESSHLREWLSDPGVGPADLELGRKTLRQVLAHRVWYDQRRGWRYTNPNLEELDLLRVEYRDLAALAADDTAFARAPDLLRNATATVRERVLRCLLDYLRQGLAVDAAALDRSGLDQMKETSAKLLRAPWGFGRNADEAPAGWRWFLLKPPSRQRPVDEEMLLRGGIQTHLGRQLRSAKLWDAPAAATLTSHAYTEMIEALLAAAVRSGLVKHVAQTPFNLPGYQLNSLAVSFRAGDGRLAAKRPNPYFSALYRAIGELLALPGHPLFDLEAREHTAQVDSRVREVREMRFRYGKKEQAELRDPQQGAGAAGESARFLPTLVCSPTMELGVDISALNVVYLRNVPPTPANYVQRAGRAGRSGQAALVVTYCAARSPHDQWFFREPRNMVHGEVRPPLLELANRELLASHLQAIWLAASRTELDGSIAALLRLDRPGLPVLGTVSDALRATSVVTEAAKRGARILALLSDELTPEAAPWFTSPAAFAQVVARESGDRFESAFRRWRELFQSAERQRDLANAVINNHAITDRRERDDAKRRWRQAVDQIELLKRGTGSASSDFYTYRYLATEGFLPGYNFPRLPLMAYIPGAPDGSTKTGFLQRPRFLGISEFGPRSLVYHEGRAYRVVAARLAIGADATAAAELPTISVRICTSCGAAHFREGVNSCHTCGQGLGDARLIDHLYRIENVDTAPTLRISANDEERQRQAFELQTVFQWAIRSGHVDTASVRASDAEGDILTLRYGAGATITRINKGLRRRKEKTVFGFQINPRTGYWAKVEDDAAEGAPDPDRTPPQRIVPYVEDQKNALHLMPSGDALDEGTLATLQHALRRGIETSFQLEEGELLVEPLPDAADRRGLLFYEATEGGAGVLSRIVSDPAAVARVARQALRVMHLEVPDDAAMPVPDVDGLRDVEGTACVAGCYRCLLSYFNQPDHELIDRRDAVVRRLLVRLSRTTTELIASPAMEEVVAPETTVDPWEARWRAACAAALPNSPAPVRSQVDGRVVFQWPDDLVAATLPGCPADVASVWQERGYDVLRFVQDQGTWPATFRKLGRLLGGAVGDGA